MDLVPSYRCRIVAIDLGYTSGLNNRYEILVAKQLWFNALISKFIHNTHYLYNIIYRKHIIISSSTSNSSILINNNNYNSFGFCCIYIHFLVLTRDLSSEIVSCHFPRIIFVRKNKNKKAPKTKTKMPPKPKNAQKTKNNKKRKIAHILHR